MNPTWVVARPARLERATCGFVVRRSIQLSYGRVLNLDCGMRNAEFFSLLFENVSSPTAIHGLPDEALVESGGERGIRTLGPDFVGTHDFQSCPFSLSGISPTRSILSLNQLRPLSDNSDLSAFAEREGCARSLRSLRLPRLWRGRRTLGPDFVGTHDFQSCPFSLSGISPVYLDAMRIAPACGRQAKRLAFVAHGLPSEAST